LDAIADLTETRDSLPAMPPESRANQVWTTRIGSTFLDTFGRPNENQDPPCERTPEATMTQSLHLMNSRELDQRIRSDSGRAARLASSDAGADAMIDELYLAGYSRFPTEQERSDGVELLTASENRRLAIEDLIWAIINSPEFTIQD
jgi:hypothetical protein